MLDEYALVKTCHRIYDTLHKISAKLTHINAIEQYDVQFPITLILHYYINFPIIITSKN